MTDGGFDYDLPRERIQCAILAAADQIRERYPDCVVDDEDDARSMTVVITGDAPAKCLNEIHRIAEESHGETVRYGQASLTRFERAKIDWSETNVFHARSCKAIATAKGEDDWLSRYDVELTVDEHRDVYSWSTGDELTMRRIPNPAEFQTGVTAA